MKKIGLAVVVILLWSHTSSAGPSWSQISFTTAASQAPAVLAAADRFMSSPLGKTFPGKLLLQVNAVDGANPATHTFVPIYKSTAEREKFVQSVQGNEAWTAFQSEMERLTQPAGIVLYRNVKSWGVINETDHVWMAHAFAVSDPPRFLAALDRLMASSTGKKFPGQVYLSAVVAGGLSPVSHVISVGYDSEVEMDAWREVRDPSADWAAYLAASQGVSDYLGASMARDLKTWGPATLAEIVAR